MTPLFQPRKARPSLVCWPAAAILLAGGLAAGCADPPEPREPSTYGQHLDAELAEERQEYINDQQQRIDDLQREIGRLEARLDGEAEFVEQEQLAEWKQELFEARVELNDAEARLQRARTASDAEWREMRGNLGITIDRAQAAVGQVGYAMRSLFAGDSEQQPADEDEREPVGGEDAPERDPAVGEEATEE